MGYGSRKEPKTVMFKYKDFTIQEEDFLKVRDEADELILRNWEDTGLEGLELNPDWSFYEAVYTAGMFGVYTVRKNTNLVGYLGIIAKNHPHYKETIFASNDVLFLDKEHRKGLVGYFLIKYCVEDLVKKGVEVLLFNTTVDKPYDPLLNKLGFKHLENLYIKKV